VVIKEETYDMDSEESVDEMLEESYVSVDFERQLHLDDIEELMEPPDLDGRIVCQFLMEYLRSSSDDEEERRINNSVSSTF
jgi:hypothetical protein